MPAVAPPAGGLAVRRREPEIMDDPGLAPERHAEALAGLARINRWSGTAGRVWRAMAALPEGDAPLRVLEVACGGGDVAVAVARRARRAGRAVELVACDLSERALEAGRARARAAGVPVRFAWGRAPDALPGGSWDLVYATLFVHHLPRAAAVDLLRLLGGRARRILVDDLRRTRAGYALAWFAGRVLAPSPVVRVDGLRSVRAAFTLGEAAELAADAGLVGARVRPVWPQRWCLEWSAPVEGAG